MGRPKLVAGDNVTMTRLALRANPGAKSTTGIVLRTARDNRELLRIRRDGLKTVQTWHQSAWRKRTTQTAKKGRYE